MLLMSLPGYTRYRFSVFLVLLAGALLLMRAHANAQTTAPTGETQLWTTFNATFELRPGFSLQTFVEARGGEDGDYLLWRAGATFSYQSMRRIKRPEADIEEEDRHYIVLGVGYEYIRTHDNGITAGEHRVGVQFTPRRTVGHVL